MGAPDSLTNNHIILFDGVCNLCNQSVQFVIQHDRQAKFSFAALQSDFGKKIIADHHLSPDKLYSVIFVSGDKIYFRSRAALEIARRLHGAWPLFYIFILIPPFIRNAVYDWIAANRYKWFGKKDACMIPTPELKSRFLG